MRNSFKPLRAFATLAFPGGPQMQQTFPMLMILLPILIAYHVPVQVGGAKSLQKPVGFAILLIPGERQVRKNL